MGPVRDSPGILEVLAFGRTASGSAVGPAYESHQGRHLAVLGETGMGKSSMMVALARRVSRTHGLVLFDPLGETAGALAREIAPDVARRTVRIDPVDHPVRINALEGLAPGGPDVVRSERRLNDLVHALRRVRAGRYVDSGFWGPRLEEMLTRAVRAAAALEGGTLSDAHTLLATGARLHRSLPPEASAPVRELGDRIRERPEDAEGARRLIYEVVRSPVLDHMLCARSPELATQDLVLPGRVVIVSGNAPRVGEATSRYLLSVYLALVWSELLARRSSSKTFVLLDEAQWFSHESLGEMLRLGRRTNVHVVIATQSIASLPESVAEAVWTNVSDFVAFRGSPEEAREFSRAAGGVSAEAILALPRGHAAVLLGKGHAIRWLRTIRVPAPLQTPATPPFEGSGGPSPSPDPPGEVVRRPHAVDDPPESSVPGKGVAPTGGPTAASVLRFLTGQAERRPRGRPLRVSVNELRRAVDPEGRAVRAAGRLLGRSGALVATERDESGSVWVLDPERIPPPPTGEAVVTSEENSRTPQPY